MTSAYIRLHVILIKLLVAVKVNCNWMYITVLVSETGIKLLSQTRRNSEIQSLSCGGRGQLMLSANFVVISIVSQAPTGHW